MVIRPPRSSAEPCGGSCCHSLLGFSVDLCASLLEHPPTVSGAAWISCRRLALKRGRAGSSPLAACLPLLGTQDDPQVGRCGVPGSLLVLLISNSLWSPENTSSQVWGCLCLQRRACQLSSLPAGALVCFVVVLFSGCCVLLKKSAPSLKNVCSLTFTLTTRGLA